MPRPTPLAGDPAVIGPLNDLALTALAQVTDHSCGHIIRTASLCIGCPQDGIRCPACAARHYDQDHTVTWRHTCDHCGTVDRDIFPAVGAMVAPAPDRTVVVSLDGLGLCPACARRGTVGRGGGVG
ncbi:hypothetical protein BH24ACT15_BH24ACT15_38330 [soil metagenome]